MDGVISVLGKPEPLYPAERDGTTFGGGICASWEQNLPPGCADDAGKTLEGAPEWCKDKYCYVDPANCDTTNVITAYFQGSNLHYSYETCGATDRFSDLHAAVRPTCECFGDTFHTQGMPTAMEDPPLQPDGSIGGPAKDWRCEACLEGARCMGGTAKTMRTKPGWFVIRSVSKATGAEKRPKLWRCPGGIAACPGGASITEVMGSKLPTATNAALACESITALTPGMREGGFKAVRLLQYPQCQCGEGATGLLCRACKSSAADIDGDTDWVLSQGIGTACRQCSMTSSDATVLVWTTTTGFIFLALCAMVGWWRYTRPSKVQKHFLNAFNRISEHGAAQMVEDFFDVPIAASQRNVLSATGKSLASGVGITKDVFVAAVIRRCASGDGIVTPQLRTEAANLWTKVDVDGDNLVTLGEFVSFVCDLRDGKHMDHSKCMSASIAFLRAIKKRWRSMKSHTLRTVIITHFQLISSIDRSFPDMVVNLSERKNTADVSAAAEAASNSTVGPHNSILALSSIESAVNNVAGAVSNVNIAVLDFIACFLGPRHLNKVVYTTVTAIGLLLVTSALPWALRCIRADRVSQHDFKMIAMFSHFCSKAQLILIFLVYPALTSTIMRTFVCKEYAQDNNGNPTTWLVDDTTVQCEHSSHVGTNATAVATAPNTYVFLWVYSWVMVIVVVIGFPALLLYRLL